MGTTREADSETKQALNLLIRAEIKRVVSSEAVTPAILEGFAHFVIDNYKKKDPKPPKAKPLALADLKAAVLARFQCADAKELKTNKDFQLAMAGEAFNLKTKADWLKLYRQWIGVPEDERAATGPTSINGIDVLTNFRPWIVFGLDSKTASAADVNETYRKLVKIHHPDHGGDARVFQQLQVMRDTLLAYYK